MLNYIHKEGRVLLLSLLVLFTALSWALSSASPSLFWAWNIVALVLFGIIAQFFRNPTRRIARKDDQLVYAPADGKVCVIEEVEEPEYFKGKRLQVSIFMSPINVHVNRNPVSGVVRYFKYHPGLYLVAWHPKSSTENERTTVVYDTGRHQILMRQVAGALARRIKWYISEGDQVEQGADMGFIKFGSRVDLYFPLGTKVLVSMDQMVQGNWTEIARLAD